MQTWEDFFRAKSARRSSRRRREKMVKAGVLSLLFGSIAAAAWLGVMGVPR